MKPLAISDSRIRDFDQLAELKSDSFNQVRNSLSAQAVYELNLDEFTKSLDGLLGDPLGRLLVTHSVSLLRLSKDSNADMGEVILALKEGLKAKGWTDEKLRLSSDLFELLKILAIDSRFGVAAKASDLYYLHSWHLHQLRIITDLRPVFDGPKESVGGFICKNSLHIRFSNPFEDEKVFEIAIGIDDLVRLAEDAKSALQKSKVLVELIESKLDVPTRTYKAHGN